MCPYLATAGVDHAIAALAARQFGVVTRAQLVTVGLAPRSIARRLANGRLHRLHAGVYAVGHQAQRREARWLAAVLACGEGAVLSHRSAATLWTIRDGEGPRPDITIPGTSGRRHPGIAIHHSPLQARDVTVHAGIPVTTPTRTVFDLAHVVNHDELTRTLKDAQYQRRFNLNAAQELLTRRPSRVFRELTEDLILTQSELEDRMVALCDRYKLPRPLTQQVVRTGTRTAFQTDRTTTNALQLAGYTVLRFTYNDLKTRPARTARQIEQALGS
jgi:predicted transcriptional regulator of viral defense system